MDVTFAFSQSHLYTAKVQFLSLANPARGEIKGKATRATGEQPLSNSKSSPPPLVLLRGVPPNHLRELSETCLLITATCLPLARHAPSIKKCGKSQQVINSALTARANFMRLAVNGQLKRSLRSAKRVSAVDRLGGLLTTTCHIANRKLPIVPDHVRSSISLNELGAMIAYMHSFARA